MKLTIYQRFRLSVAKVKTPAPLYYLHRKLFYLTNGLTNSIATALIKIFNPKNLEIAATPVKFSNLTAKQIADKIRQDGFYQFEQRLDDQIIQKILDFAKTEKTVTRRNLYVIDYNTAEKISYDEMLVDNSARFDFTESDMCKSNEIMQLAFDKSFCNIAQEYFGSLPVMEPFGMWWSKPCADKKLQSHAAQQFHYDMDRIKFLKIFIYITDVTSENGPHCYVKGSHKNLKKSLRKDGRYEDQEIENAYGKESIIEFCAPRGTIYAVDTRGLHKGVPLRSSNRLILQMMFSNSTFGQDYVDMDIKDATDFMLKNIEQYPLIYGPFFKMS